MSGTRPVAVRRKVPSKNDTAARLLRQRFEEAQVTVISLASSPGSGKTVFLERILSSFRPNYRVAAVVGDPATDHDAIRLSRSHVPVRQICTGTISHLDASMVTTALDDWSLDDLDFLFIENVGNLVCPASYDLGEHARMVLLSVTEGEDKPLKYPAIFNYADIAVITKSDLARTVEFSWEGAEQNIESVHPGMPTFRVSAKSGEGMTEIMRWMEHIGGSCSAAKA